MGIAYDRGEPPVIDWDNKIIKGERLRILTVRNIHLLPLKDIISEVERLFEVALQKHFSMQDTSGYTAIFNNIGVLGHHSGRALLTPGISSELNMGSVDPESGEAVVQLVLDHRLIDGAMTTPFFRALHKELTQRVLPELEALLSEKNKSQ
jgi:pyruvate/2-oxoglutarate dehydrogenase complex dihydrolipoamide acyltransferase (E2) component